MSVICVAKTGVADNEVQSGNAGSVYYLSIGSQFYVQSAKPGVSSFPVRGAQVHSATRVADVLDNNGAVYGILLLSDKNRFISRDDMRQAIFDLKSRIRNDGAEHPVIVFYVMAHGLGDKASTDLCVVPGNVLLINGSNAQTNRIKFIKSMLCVDEDVVPSLFMFRTHSSMAHWDRVFMSDLMPDLSDLSDVMRVVKLSAKLQEIDDDNRRNKKYLARNPDVPYVVMIDNCYGGVVSDIIGQNFVGDAKSEVEDGGVVLYASHPGDSVGDFPDPDNTVVEPVGALARRLILLFEKYPVRLTIGGFLSKITDNKFKDVTQVPFFISKPKPAILDTVLFDKRTSRNLSITRDVRYGTSAPSNEPVYCCK